jgi:hypothetical protein
MASVLALVLQKRDVSTPGVDRSLSGNILKSVQGTILRLQ